MSVKQKGSAEERIAERIERLATPRAPLANTPLVGELTRRERKALEAEAKFSSLRAYRRALDQVIAWALLGKMGTKQAQEIATTIRIASEVLMSEHILTATGRADVEPAHMDGDHGGAPIMPTAAPDHVTASVERRVGIGQDGNPIDETRVIATGGRGLLRDTPFDGPTLPAQERAPLPSVFDD